MKHHILNLNTKHIISLGMLIGISIIIWFGGPLLVIADQHLLHQPEKRCFIIAILFLAWIFYALTETEEKTSKKMTPTGAEGENNLEALQGRFEGALHFLKKTTISKHDKRLGLIHLPWYLIIGPNNAGKTTLLAKANVNYILTKQFTNDIINPSDACDWWITRDLVFVDVPGTYLKGNNNVLWNHFINLIKKQNNARSLGAVVMALPLPELIKQKNSQQKKQIVVDLKHKISQLREQFAKNLPVYIVITKCDLLPGFLEFFNESSNEEIAQAWGITFPTCKSNENLLEILTQRFNVLIKRLNNQLIWRLHQERNPSTRPLIKDFPLQIERLKESLCNFLKALSVKDLHLQGVYLTSAIQSHADEHTSQPQIINPNTYQALQLLRTPPFPSKAYFVRQLILQGLLSSADPATQTKTKNRWTYNFAYVASIGAIVTAALLLGHDFQQNVLQTYALQNNLAQYQLSIQQPNQQGDHLLKALPVLNTLKTAANQTDSNASIFANLLSFYSDKSQKTANKLYQQSLQTIALPAIKNSLEDYLRHANEKNPVQVYAVLKAYIMLANTQILAPHYIVSTIKGIIPTGFGNQFDDVLISHINAAYANLSKPLELNNGLINQVRNSLSNVSSQELALIILKNMNNNYSDSAISLGTCLGNQPVFVNHRVENQVPNLFTATKFSSVYSQEIALAATEALQGNWVIGNAETLPSPATINELVAEVRARYVANYIDLWESLLSNLKLASPSNLLQTDTMITTLMSDSSPLLRLLQTLKQNTSFEPIVEASPKILTLNNLLTNAQSNQNNPLYQIFISLRQLHFYLQTILNTNDVTAAAFEAAKNRMENPTSDPITQVHLLADQNPEPLKSWLNALADQSWYFILQEASQYIENAWQVNIYSIYSSQFANKFPFNQHSHVEMDLQQFANFAGKKGIFPNFYERFLKPFVNENHKQWRWRMVDHQKIPFGESIPDQLQQTFKIQNLPKYVLFSQGRKHNAVRQLKLPERLAEK